MLKNYFKIALRNLKRSKANTAINVLGLSMGIACAILIFTLIKFHLSFDSFHPEKNRIYRIVTEDHLEQITYSPGIPSAVGNTFRREYPFFEKTAMVYVRKKRQISLPYRTGDNKFQEEEGVAFAEPDFFKIFNFPLITGDRNNILSEPNTAIVTNRIARKYFGNENPIGKTIRLDNKLDFQITGILQDIPKNTDRRQEIYLSYKNLKDHNPWVAQENWLGYAHEQQCFVVLKQGVLASTVNKAFPEFTNRHYQGDYQKEWQFRLQPLSDIHSDINFDGVMPKKDIWALSLIAIFIIITASFNFINMATAQALSRSKEIGIRKALGSLRYQVFWQFVAETALVVFSSTCLAFILIILSLPFVSNLSGIPFNISFLYDRSVLLFLAALTILITFISGTYPGLILAGFQPVLALKGKLSLKHVGGIKLRKGLVTMQLAISQLLIIGTLVIIRQMEFTRKTDLGFTKDAVVMLPLPAKEQTKLSALRSELTALPGVKTISFCNQVPASEQNNNFEIVYAGRTQKENYDVIFKAADDQYLSLFGLRLVAGRNIYPSDTIREYLVNETLIKRLGISKEDAIGKNITVNDQKGSITGVVKDFHNQSLHAAIDPLCITTAVNYYSTCAIKVSTQNLKTTLAGIQKSWTIVFPENIYQHEFLDQRIAHFYEQDNKTLQLIQLFTTITIIISCLGLYGLVAFVASQKTKEVGIRKVLGASIQSIIWIFGKEFTQLLLIAFIFAAPLAWLIMNNWLQNFAYRIEIGAQIFIYAILSSFCVAIITVGYRAVKAALVNPVKSLKSE